jgi:hypothetical protein
VISQTSTPNVKNSPNCRTNAFMLIYACSFSMRDLEVRISHVRTSNDGFLHRLMGNNISSHITYATLWYFRQQINEPQIDEYDSSPSCYRVSSSDRKYYFLISYLAKQIGQIIDACIRSTE